ncbi:MAG: type II/IV secretion system protein [Holosporales bacterium]|nr:type II/IV secretion system protein [Holosporales bacterium]
MYHVENEADVRLCDEEEVAQSTAAQYDLEYTTLGEFQRLDGIDYESMSRLSAIPIAICDGAVHIAISDPGDLITKDQIGRCLSNFGTTRELPHVYYVASNTAISRKYDEVTGREVDLVELAITEALSKSASDLHITPFRETFQIMFRINGALSHRYTVPIEKFQQLAIALKVRARLDMSETRRPQSGHFQKGNIDFRISTHPTMYGENIVIRILNKDKNLISIEGIGFSSEQIEYLKSVTSHHCGMVIFCGPTGSGKTTSIYSLLETMDKKSRNIMTLEDPIEYRISDVKQTEIIRGVIDFADGVRSILRQDPDVILIGEIRDEETAKMAVRASMTGHLVLTTIHANDSFGVISRLREFDISSSLIADNIIAVVAQRLVRKRYEPGRTIVSEILKISKKVEDLIHDNASMRTLKEYVISSEGFRSMRDDCINKIKNGLIDEGYAASIL